MNNKIKKIFTELEEDLKKLSSLDSGSKTHFTDACDYERRLTLSEMAKLIHAGKEDILICLSPNTRTYWLYSHVLDAYCDMDYEGWEQTEENMERLVENREYLYPMMPWRFGDGVEI